MENKIDIEYQKKIELAKSWFVLAQISVILAGFFFATAGIHYNNALRGIEKQNDLNIATLPTFIDIYTKLYNSDKASLDEAISSYGKIMNSTSYAIEKLVVDNNKNSFRYNAMGIILVALAVYLFNHGRKKVRDIR